MRDLHEIHRINRELALRAAQENRRPLGIITSDLDDFRNGEPIQLPIVPSGDPTPGFEKTGGRFETAATFLRFARPGHAYAIDEGGSIREYRQEETPERPDLPHDSDCTYRLSDGRSECSCNKDSRPDETAVEWILEPCFVPETTQRIGWVLVFDPTNPASPKVYLSGQLVNEQQARLIAAAPKLYQFAKKIQSYTPWIIPEGIRSEAEELVRISERGGNHV